MKRLFTIVTVAGCAAVASAQTGTLDQHSPWEGISSPVQGASFNLSAASLTWQAQIRAGVDGQLEGIEIGTTGDAGAMAIVQVREGGGWSTNPVLFEAEVVKRASGPENIFIDMSSADIMLEAGDLFVMESFGNETGMNFLGTYVPPASGAPPAYEEPLFLNMSLFADGQWRHGFKTYMLEGGGECYADCDDNEELDFFDFLCFQNEFAAGAPYADCDESGDLDFFDFLCFQNEFAAGCP